MATSKGTETSGNSTPPTSADSRPPASTRVRRDIPSPQEEVAARSADTDEKSSDAFVKVFTCLKDVELTDTLHYANRLATVREMLNRGMRVPNETADVVFEGEEDAPDGESKYLTYSVTALPAGRLPEDAPLNRIQTTPGEQPDDPRI